ncbi:UDP-glucose/GDP-mannose dehydrogenase family protein [candidate division WWE3 bacterium]|nr:UDP-glucose/GDP-mannose dehydrogenase family protein [candidate division WWE3 bacterium]
MKLCVIGTGYVGLVGAAVFADWGNEVIGVDIDEAKIKKIERGIMPIYEPGLSDLVLLNVKQKRLSFTTNLKKGIQGAEIVFICVGTPQSKSGSADLSQVWQVSENIGKFMTDKIYKVIVTKSTVPVGTNEKVKQILKKFAPKSAKFDVASNPEFLREGCSVKDMQKTERTVVGTETERAMKVMRKFYEHLNMPIVECDLRSSEMIKYASNAFLATKISFINEMAQLCEKAGADVVKVAEGMGLDSRIGSKFLNAGIGYGGACFPKDVSALRRTSLDFAYDFALLQGVMRVNDVQKHYFANKIYEEFGGENLSGLTFACLGLAFKGDTDDTRESVAIKIIHLLRGRGAQVRVYDPEAMENAKRELGTSSVFFAKDKYEVLKGADAMLILTEWGEFKDMDLTKVKKLLKKPLIFDGRNLLDKKVVEANGFKYLAIGRKTGSQKQKAPDFRAAIL